jgi:hypothetical protein
MIQGAADGCVGQFREREPPIALLGKLGIEWNGPEAGDPQAGRRRGMSRVEGLG